MSEPVLGEAEASAVLSALRDGWVSSGGPLVPEFERRIASLTGARSAVATSSGTAAIHTALAALGITADDCVIVPSLTFVGSVNPVTYVGASPVIVDVRPSDGTLDADALHAYLEGGTRTASGRLLDEATGKRVRAVIPVHLYGAPADMEGIQELAQRYELEVIEDAAEALGSLLKGRACGTWSRVGALSFNGNKIITTGGGGMVLTDDEQLAVRMRYLTTQARDDPLEYVHHEIGFNYRLTNIQAALGLGQLASFEEKLRRKHEIARMYREALRDAPLRFLESGVDATPNHWLTAVILQDKASRRPVLEGLREAGVEARSFFVPLHRQRPHERARRWGQLAVADGLYDSGLNLPSSSDLTDDDVQYVAGQMRSLLAHVVPA